MKLLEFVMLIRAGIIAMCVAAAIAATASGANAQSDTGAWNGPYVGGNAGYGWGTSNQRDLTIPPSQEEEADGSYHVHGGLIGATAGYSRVFNYFLLGIEADIDWAHVDGSSSVCGGTHVCGTKLQSVGTGRVRVGVVTGANLFYATGGVAIGRIHAYDVTAPGYSATKSDVGWTAGIGVEHRWTNKWSTKLEYLYMDFGARDYFTIAGHTPERIDLEVHSLRIGLNYRFGAEDESESPK